MSLATCQQRKHPQIEHCKVNGYRRLQLQNTLEVSQTLAVLHRKNIEGRSCFPKLSWPVAKVEVHLSWSLLPDRSRAVCYRKGLLHSTKSGQRVSGALFYRLLSRLNVKIALFQPC